MNKNATRLVWLSWTSLVLKLMGRFLHGEMLSCLLCGVGQGTADVGGRRTNWPKYIGVEVNYILCLRTTWCERWEKYPRRQVLFTWNFSWTSEREELSKNSNMLIFAVRMFGTRLTYGGGRKITQSQQAFGQPDNSVLGKYTRMIT